MSNCILEMKNITKRFVGVVALDDVSIDLYQGEILAIVGENGAGKSTLMKVLSGNYNSNTYSGSIYVNGEEKRMASPHDAEEAGIEMIYQEISMHLDSSIAENIFLGRIPSKGGIVNWKKVNEAAKQYTDMLGLKVSPKQNLRQLSTSQQQMVAIARALSRKPKILVLDEPTSALTESEVKVLFDILIKLKNQGISSIFISHKLKEVMKIADRITILRDSHKISTRKIEDTNVERMVEEMVNRKITNMYPKREVPIGRELLRVENLSVIHPYTNSKLIVNDVSFSVHAGEILGIVGLMGAGRSETVNAIFGSIRKKSGKVYVEQNEVNIKNPRRAIKHGMALLTEDRKKNGFVEAFNVAKNSTLASFDQISKYSILRKKKETSKAQEYIEKIGIKVRGPQDNILQLSGGNQQKVVLSKWLMTNPKVLFLDEPTRGIDVGAKTQIYEIMCDLAEQGIAVVVISSELPELVGMCDRFIVLSEGKLVGELSRSEADEEVFLKMAAIGIE